MVFFDLGVFLNYLRGFFAGLMFSFVICMGFCAGLFLYKNSGVSQILPGQHDGGGWQVLAPQGHLNLHGHIFYKNSKFT